MRLLCFSCGKSVTNELPNDTILRAIAICPECLLKETDDTLQQQVSALTEQLAESREYADKLAQGLPEGMLPKDIEILRDANTKLGQENFKLKGQLVSAEQTKWKLIDQLKEANEDTQDLSDAIQDVLNSCIGMGVLEQVLEHHRAHIAGKEG